jgi:tRNA dimethylallyltransferase
MYSHSLSPYPIEEDFIASSKPPLIVIVGPTAVGKTDISIRLAERLDGEIVSADSRLFYRGMNIGTAKPSVEQQRRVAHHLIDVADPDQSWSLAVFQSAAQVAISNIHRRGHLPFMVGGTGQYVRAVIEGWDLPKVQPNIHLRQALENWADELGAEGLHARLSVVDPMAAERIDPNNLRRTIRALEVILTTGKLFSTQRQRKDAMYRSLLLGLTRPRQELYRRIDERIDQMFAQGFVGEVEGLLDAGYSPQLPTLSAIGYREVVAYLKGSITLDEAIVLIRRATRKFVRRQANWFKASDENIIWFDVDSDTIDKMENTIIGFLSSMKTKRNET